MENCIDKNVVSKTQIYCSAISSANMHSLIYDLLVKVSLLLSPRLATRQQTKT